MDRSASLIWRYIVRYLSVRFRWRALRKIHCNHQLNTPRELSFGTAFLLPFPFYLLKKRRKRSFVSSFLQKRKKKFYFLFSFPFSFFFLIKRRKNKEKLLFLFLSKRKSKEKRVFSSAPISP